MTLSEYHKLYRAYIRGANESLAIPDSDDPVKLKDIYSPQLYNLIFNQEEVFDTIPLLINSTNVWIKLTALFCLSNKY